MSRVGTSVVKVSYRGFGGQGQSTLSDAGSREGKARKILAVLVRELGGDLSSLMCLDLGCSSGLIARSLAERFAYTVGLEYDGDSARQALRLVTKCLTIVRGDGLRLPLADESVDVVVCAQVYEHVADARRLFSEIWRVLAPGGVCFLSGPNRLFPIEMHCRLPFVHWLPFGWARAVVRALKPGFEYDVRPQSLWSLRRELASFRIVDCTIAMVADPAGHSCADEMRGFLWLSKLPAPLLGALLPIVPNFNWLLIKPESRDRIEAADPGSGSRL